MKTVGVMAAMMFLAFVFFVSPMPAAIVDHDQETFDMDRSGGRDLGITEPDEQSDQDLDQDQDASSEPGELLAAGGSGDSEALVLAQAMNGSFNPMTEVEDRDLGADSDLGTEEPATAEDPDDMDPGREPSESEAD